MKVSKTVKKQLLNGLFVVALLVITLVILFTSNKDLSYADIKNYFADCNFGILSGALVCMILFIVFEAVSLHIITRKLGYRPKFRSSLAYSSADLYYSALTPSATGGQPASAYYMVRDGIDGGTSGFALMFNIFAYTGAILVMGVVAFIAGFSIFGQFGTFVKVIVLVGFFLQLVLFAFFFACMKYDKFVLKLGNGCISLVTKMKLMKKPEKWREKWQGAVVKYHNDFEVVKKHPSLFVWALLLNILQRASQLMITYFVCAAVLPSVSPLEIFCAQAFITLGYNSFPLPGGSGVYELLYIQSYRAMGYENHFVIVAVMVTRLISYYLLMIVSGVYTLVYHMLGGKSKKIVPKADEGEEETSPEPVSETPVTTEEKTNLEE
ncbi:MAG: flippase-like domain-containing protein [Clostridia bacterium]|nr:flippase-like domain-containing protein [Clostridia bacterium]